MAFNIGVLKLPVIKKGSQGTVVIAWQRFLKENEFPIGTIDGDFGNGTDAATRSYQRKNQLSADGVVGNNTYIKALNQGFIFKVPNFSANLLLAYLRFGSSEVKDLQRSLNAIAQLTPPLVTDGDFGNRSNQGLAEAYKKRDVRLRTELAESLSNSTKTKLGNDFQPALDLINTYSKRLRFRLSGSHWYNYFPTSRAISALASPFRERVQAFQKALIDGGAQTIISATYRPPQRAYLMHYAARIDRGEISPNNVPAMAGVDIDWVHYTASGARQAASQMVDIYGIGGNPVALKSLHTQRLAIDWNITWEDTLRIKNSNGNIVEINEPRNGFENKLLFDVGASYGVYKLLYRDPPHWSYNGH